jgi:hypothetical protein
MKIETTNPRICTFYKENHQLNFDAVNLFFIDIFEKLLTDMNTTMNSTIQSQILTSIYNNNNNINELKSSIVNLKESISNNNNENYINLISKINDLKRDYIEDVKTTFQNNTYEKIGPLIEKNNNILIDKTSIVLNELIPKNQAQHYSKLQESMDGFYKTLSDDSKTLLKSIDNNSIKEFINNFEIKSSLMLQNIQQPICSFISNSEERINNNINTIKENHNNSQNTHQKIVNELNDTIKRFYNDDRNKSQQNYSEKQLSKVLNKMYNSAEILLQNTGLSNDTNTSSILMKRMRKTNIFIQSKDEPENINIDDVNTFLGYCEEHNYNGIFLSQSSGISSKKNYQIEFHNNSIIVYVHNVEYSPTKIEAAIDIIDNLSMKLRQFKTADDDCTVPKDILDTINNEYQLFLSQKNALFEVFKESQKKVFAQIDEIRFPSLDKFLSTKYAAPIQKPGLKCDLCKLFNANNLKALAAHKRGCARKNTNSNSNILKVR